MRSNAPLCSDRLQMLEALEIEEEEDIMEDFPFMRPPCPVAALMNMDIEKEKETDEWCVWVIAQPSSDERCIRESRCSAETMRGDGSG